MIGSVRPRPDASTHLLSFIPSERPCRLFLTDLFLILLTPAFFRSTLLPDDAHDTERACCLPAKGAIPLVDVDDAQTDCMLTSCLEWI